MPGNAEVRMDNVVCSRQEELDISGKFRSDVVTSHKRTVGKNMMISIGCAVWRRRFLTSIPEKIEHTTVQ